MFYKLHSQLIVSDADLTDCLQAIINHKLMPIIGERLLPCSVLFGMDEYGEFMAMHIDAVEGAAYSVKIMAGSVIDDAMHPHIVIECLQTSPRHWQFQHAFAHREPIDFNGAMVYLDQYADLPFISIDRNDDTLAA